MVRKVLGTVDRRDKRGLARAPNQRHGGQGQGAVERPYNVCTHRGVAAGQEILRIFGIS